MACDVRYNESTGVECSIMLLEVSQYSLQLPVLPSITPYSLYDYYVKVKQQLVYHLIFTFFATFYQKNESKYLIVFIPIKFLGEAR